MIISISSKDLKNLKPEEIYFVDVREKDEFNEDHIPGSHNMPLSTFKAREILAFLPSEKKCVFYCHAGKRSMDVCNLLEEENDIDFTFYNLEGGIIDYQSK